MLSDAGIGGVCITVAEEGMRCDGQYVRCASGTECKASQCVAIDDLGIFSKCQADGGI